MGQKTLLRHNAEEIMLFRRFLIQHSIGKGPSLHVYFTQMENIPRTTASCLTSLNRGVHVSYIKNVQLLKIKNRKPLKNKHAQLFNPITQLLNLTTYVVTVEFL